MAKIITGRSEQRNNKPFIVSKAVDILLPSILSSFVPCDNHLEKA